MVIDYVVPMVFHEDAEWRKNFDKIGSWYDEGDLGSVVRYRSWRNEHLLIKCVKRFMPFVRTIYVILAQESQKQAWMDKEGVRIVYHEDIIPERYLPTFNSQTIEMYLTNIPDLSERFIYGNDDMFPVAALTEEDFFYEGLPCVHYQEVAFPDEPNYFHFGCRNGLNFVAEEFGKKYINTWLKCGHGLTPMLKSTWKHLWERDKEIEKSLSPFREPKNFNQWLCPWWHYFSGQYIDVVPETVYVSPKNSITEVLEAILSDSSKIVCINDNEALDDYEAFSEIVNRAIEERYKQQ